MRTVGVVCEFNPFHKGHLYLIEEIRRRLEGETVVVCVLSGDYVQRGEAAVFDKFTRAEAACLCGADLVLELPLPWCLSSAEVFASGAVRMLCAAGCDTIAFGSESGDARAIERLADFLLEPDTLSGIHERMDRDETLSFARARQQLVEEALGREAALLSDANDILAVEYLKALRKYGADMETLVIQRKGGGHDSLDSGEICSAMRLRQELRRGGEIAGFVPREAMAILKQAISEGRTINQKYLEIALLSRLYGMQAEAFERLPDAGGGAARRLCKALQAGGGLEQITVSAATKRYTVSRMRRMLLCAALGISAEDAEGDPPYLRVLAANRRGREKLHAERASGQIPYLIKPAFVRKLGAKSLRVFTLGSDAHDLYILGCCGTPAPSTEEDWRRKAAIV